MLFFFLLFSLKHFESSIHLIDDLSKQGQTILCTKDEACTVTCLSSVTYQNVCSGTTITATSNQELTINCQGDGTSCRNIKVIALDASKLTINVFTQSNYVANNLENADIIAPNNGAYGYTPTKTTFINCGNGEPPNLHYACGYNMVIKAEEGWNDVELKKGINSDKAIYIGPNGANITMKCGINYAQGTFVDECLYAIASTQDSNLFIGDNNCGCNTYQLPTTLIPTQYPTDIPTKYPTKIPTNIPSKLPTMNTVFPTILTVQPTYIPTLYPTIIPTYFPTQNPTIDSSEYKYFNGYFFGLTDFYMFLICGVLGFLLIICLILMIAFCRCQCNKNKPKKVEIIQLPTIPSNQISNGDNKNNNNHNKTLTIEELKKLAEIEKEKQEKFKIEVKGANEYNINRDPELRKISIENEYKNRQYKSIFDGNNTTFKDADIELKEKEKINKLDINNPPTELRMFTLSDPNLEYGPGTPNYQQQQPKFHVKPGINKDINNVVDSDDDEEDEGDNNNMNNIINNSNVNDIDDDDDDEDTSNDEEWIQENRPNNQNIQQYSNNNNMFNNNNNIFNPNINIQPSQQQNQGPIQQAPGPPPNQQHYHHWSNMHQQQNPMQIQQQMHMYNNGSNINFNNNSNRNSMNFNENSMNYNNNSNINMFNNNNNNRNSGTYSMNQLQMNNNQGNNMNNNNNQQMQMPMQINPNMFPSNQFLEEFNVINGVSPITNTQGLQESESSDDDNDNEFQQYQE